MPVPILRATIPRDCTPANQCKHSPFYCAVLQTRHGHDRRSALQRGFSIPPHGLCWYWPTEHDGQATHTPDGGTSTPDAHPYVNEPLDPVESDTPGVHVSVQEPPSARLPWLAHVPVESVSLNAGSVHAADGNRGLLGEAAKYACHGARWALAC
jgi:hypothetical protein